MSERHREMAARLRKSLPGLTWVSDGYDLVLGSCPGARVQAETRGNDGWSVKASTDIGRLGFITTDERFESDFCAEVMRMCRNRIDAAHELREVCMRWNREATP